MKKINISKIPEEPDWTDEDQNSNNIDSTVIEVNDSYNEEPMPAPKKSVKYCNKKPSLKNDERAQILKSIRNTSRKFRLISDTQLMYMTDPQVLSGLEGKSQPQLLSFFQKDPIFS